MNIEDARTAKQLKETKQLAAKIKFNRENRESKMALEKELMQN